MAEISIRIPDKVVKGVALVGAARAPKERNA